MSSKQDIDKALHMVDGLQNLSDNERQLLKEYVLKAAKGDNEALGHIIISSYDPTDRELVGEIISLILQPEMASPAESESQNQP